MDDSDQQGPRVELIAALTRAAATLGGETFHPDDLQGWARWRIRITSNPQNPRPDWTRMPADALPLEDINGMTPGGPAARDPDGPHLCGYARRAGLPLIAGTLQGWANLRRELSDLPEEQPPAVPSRWVVGGPPASPDERAIVERLIAWAYSAAASSGSCPPPLNLTDAERAAVLAVCKDGAPVRAAGSVIATRRIASARNLNQPTPACEVAPPGPPALVMSPPSVLADLLTAEDRLAWRVHWELNGRVLNKTDEGWREPPASERWMFRDRANQSDRWVRLALRALLHTKGCPLGLFALLDDALREARACIGSGGQGDEIHAPYLHRIGGEAEALDCVMRAVVVLCYAAAAATRRMSQQSVSRLASAPGEGWLPEPLRVAQDALADPDLCGELDFRSFRDAVSEAVTQIQAEAAEQAAAAEAARLPATTIELYPSAKPGGEWRGVLLEEGRDPHEFRARSERRKFLLGLPTTPGVSEAPEACTNRRENLRARAPRLYQAIERYTTYSKGRIRCTAPGLTIREFCGEETVP